MRRAMEPSFVHGCLEELKDVVCDRGVGYLSRDLFAMMTRGSLYSHCAFGKGPLEKRFAYRREDFSEHVQ